MKKSLLTALLMIVVVIASRLLPHPANFSPISALLLLSPLGPFALVGLLISDLFLGFHSTMIFVYGSYLLIAMLRKFGRKVANPIVSAFLFYTVTNFGVWASTSMYTHDLSGLLQSYWMGIPFLRNTLLGDLFFFSVIYVIFSVRKYRETNFLRVSV